MQITDFQTLTYHFIFSLILFASCNGAGSQTIPKPTTPGSILVLKPAPQIADYIREIYQDKQGGLWFGTNGYGVAHYDGESVSYFSNAQGFHGSQITGMTEDLDKNIWFATDQGVVKYDWSTKLTDKKCFTNYSSPDYFEGQRFWSIYADSKGNVWAGSVAGIYRFNGTDWAPFELPYPKKITGEFITAATTWSITEDSKGNIWFSTNGYGAFKYDQTVGQASDDRFRQYSEKDGLTDNSVDIIMEDSKGNMWFGTRFGGVSQYDGSRFINFTSNDSIGNDEVCILYEDKQGHIWMSSEGYGVYKYDGSNFSNYGVDEGLGVRAVQTIFEDREGRFWVGGGGGLYRLEGNTFVNVTKNGPWK